MSGGGAIRIANCSGFYGDRLSAAREMVDGGPIDVLCGDYLAELTMLILWKSRAKDPARGYATTFMRQMEDVLGTCAERGIKIVANAGGLNPAGLAAGLDGLAQQLGLGGMSIAYVDGDDIVGDLDALVAAGHDFAHLDTGAPLAEAASKPITANAYLGGWGIASALGAGADVVVTGRVTDASLVVGPAAWYHGWERTDWDRLAGAVVAGHVIECGAQCCGGNYAFFTEVPGLDDPGPGFPIAEVEADGSSVITKHPGTGGLVSVGTVTAQLLYEIAGPRYANTDVVALFDTITLSDDGPDRVRVSGVRGDPAPADTKICLNLAGGYRNTMTFVLTGLDIERKAELARTTILRLLFERAPGTELAFDLARFDHPDAPTNAEASAELRVSVKGPDAATVGRSFSNAFTELALASYPGFHLTAPPGDASVYGVYWPALLPAELVPHRVHLPGGKVRTIEPVVAGASDGKKATAPFAHGGHDTKSAADQHPGGSTRKVPLGVLIGARSGDKGGNANVGLWARSDAAWRWLEHEMTEARFVELVPEAAGLRVTRHALPNLRALNFVVAGLLGEGVASSTRRDPQAKSLGEYVRSRFVEIPEELLADLPGGPDPVTRDGGGT
ncbi:MAG: DUF1446 domain-containing protein [Actinomycetota bacterium]|nr:DUF1446 domain-containing protein [Actinomycetota bacterium]